MAKLKMCKTCNKEVSSSAKKCPHCGQKLRMGFFLKGLLWLVGIIVVIVVLVNIGGKTDAPASGSATTGAKTTDAPAELSKEGVSSDVKITVDGFETKDSIGDNEFATAKAQGVFKIVKVTLINNQNDAITIDSNSFKLLDDKGREFSYSSEAQIALMSSLGNKEEPFFLKSVNPGISISGTMVYDVPKDAKGFVLEARGGMLGKAIKLKVE